MTVLWIVLAVIVILLLVAVFSVQRPGTSAQSHKRSVVADRRRAQTPARPHSQSGEHSQGLRRTRERNVRGGDPGAGRRRQRRRLGDPAQIAPAENALSASLRSLFAVAENYPTLRAVESFKGLQEQLTATEDKLEYARRYYNTSRLGLQHGDPDLPAHADRGTVRIHTGGVLRVADASERAVPVVDFGSPAQPSAG